MISILVILVFHRFSIFVFFKGREVFHNMKNAQTHPFTTTPLTLDFVDLELFSSNHLVSTNIIPSSIAFKYTKVVITFQANKQNIQATKHIFESC